MSKVTPLTNQQLFDNAYLGVIAQGKLALSRYGSCVYLSEDGCKCGIGQSIPSNLYDRSIEGRTFGDLSDPRWVDDRKRLRVGLAHLFSEVNKRLAEAIQLAHDDARTMQPNDPVAYFRRQMISLAEYYGLTVPDLPTTDYQERS